MIYECKILKPNGKLQKIYTQKDLKKKFWEEFNSDPLGKRGSNLGKQEPTKIKNLQSNIMEE
jgi:hypothetical protein